MKPDDGFLQNIIENPDDDTPRLIYADWLEEHGESDRAEFIRVQCELANLGEQAPYQLPHLQREESLLARNRICWLGPIANWATYALFSRGFVERVVMPASVFLQHSQPLFSLAPIRRVRLLSVPRLIGRIANTPHLCRLTELDLQHADRGGDEEVLDAVRLADLLASPYLPHLRRLLLSGNRIGDAGVEVLVGSPILAQLDGLWLCTNNIGNRGMEILGNTPQIARLEILSLAGNPMDEPAVSALVASSYLRQVRRLYFGPTSSSLAALPNDICID